jgi:hypothetical protein
MRNGDLDRHIDKRVEQVLERMLDKLLEERRALIESILECESCPLREGDDA